MAEPCSAATQGIGRFCYRDVLVAEGERQPVAGQPAPDKGLIDAALMGCDLDRLQAQATALDEAIGAARAIETALTDRVGAAQSCSLDNLLKKLREVAKVVQSGLARRGVGSAPDDAPQEAGGTVLDHSTILFGSNMSNSDKHNNDPLPAAILGHANGKIKGGQHVKYPQDSRFADLLVTLFDRNNIPVEKLGDSGGILSEI